MKSIQVVIGEKLLSAADREARKRKVNRSALIREALREHLERARRRELEEREIAAYRRRPDDEFDVWDGVATWPRD